MGAPRIGNHEYLITCQILEYLRCFRYLRYVSTIVVNDTTTPYIPLFHNCHAGFQLKTITIQKNNHNENNKNQNNKNHNNNNKAMSSSSSSSSLL